MKHSVLRIFIIFCSLTMLAACQSKNHSETPAESAPAETADTAQEVVKTDYAVYEAVFLDSEEVTALFDEVRGPAPYENVTADFHVTITFLPEKDARELYGKEVTVKITGYKAGDVTTEEGETVQNEGFKVELLCDDPEVRAFLEANPAEYHITGSYSDKPKYTAYLDFSDARPLNYTIPGKLGAYLDSGRITFDGDDVGKEY